VNIIKKRARKEGYNRRGGSGKGRRPFFSFLAVIFIILVFIIPETFAVISGQCSNCHTMHNSQNGSPMATYGSTQPWGSPGPNEMLLRGTCLGCHGMGVAQKIVTIGNSKIPQVYHLDASGDLAGGNFAYITGDKGTGASDTKGHNVIELGNLDDILYWPPGKPSNHGGPNAATLSCAGNYGCHGWRVGGYSPLEGIRGAHHLNQDGQLTLADEVYNSYRFLKGVYGYENMTAGYEWQNVNSLYHNEYYGATQPFNISDPLQSGECSVCHVGGIYVEPSTHTMSGFCGTCHGMFHSLTGIGGDTSSPFTRHPTDVVLPTGGEFDAYTTYNVDAPVARTSVPAAPSSTVTSGTDVVMCLSCHVAHASDYPDLLRWDYSQITTGGSGGCLICHTGK
jgi:hypothetical protein